MATPLRAGVIGTGFMGGVHCDAVRAAGLVVNMVAGSDAASAAAAAPRLGGRPAASVEDLIDSPEVDVVHVCTPNSSHAALAEAALSAGKAVICEKPLATSVVDARRLSDQADRSGLVTAVPFVYRFHPVVREIRSRIAAGEAGRLWLLHGSYLQDWFACANESNWRVKSASGGKSRAFGDIGVHWCDLMEFVTGHRIVAVAARTAQAHRERGGKPVNTEDGATLIFQTDRGSSGSLVVSQVSHGRKNRLWFSFDGTEGSYSFDAETPDTFWVGGVAENRTVFRGPHTLSAEASRYSRLPAGHPQGYQDAFNAFIADAYAAVGGATPDGLPTFADGLRAAVITEAVVNAAASEQWLEVPPHE